MNQINRFKALYEKAILSEPNVKRISYMGSTEREYDWKPGKSDLDILIYGWGIPGEVKRHGILLIRDLNFKLHLRLEKVPLEHPTPAYIDSPSRHRIASILLAPGRRGFTEPVRQFFENHPPPLTHQIFWKIAESMPPPLTQFL